MKRNFSKFAISSVITIALNAAGNSLAYAEDASRPFECSFRQLERGPGKQMQVETDQEFRARMPQCFPVAKQEGPARKPVAHRGLPQGARQDDAPQMIKIEVPEQELSKAQEPSSVPEEKPIKRHKAALGVGVEMVPGTEVRAAFIEGKFNLMSRFHSEKSDLQEFPLRVRAAVVKDGDRTEAQIQKITFEPVQPFANEKMTYLAGFRIYDRDSFSISSGTFVPHIGLGRTFGKTNTKTHIGLKIHPIFGYFVTAHDSKSNGALASSGELILAQRLGEKADLDAKVEVGTEWNPPAFYDPSPLLFLKSGLGVTVRPGQNMYVRAEALHQRAEKRDLTPPTTSTDYAHGAGAQMTEVKLSAGVNW